MARSALDRMRYDLLCVPRMANITKFFEYDNDKMTIQRVAPVKCEASQEGLFNRV